ncbi:adenine phosphoribosyltransferase-like [Vigna umbellata]|uniref:adenine phosphoribosyltransferase-like n=1 Tax=Vigna umbellata TaxID=87088 RepID=UPI001F5E7CFC|nr:adenine phosphoribosyltransferase-like [Vigna umbellata]
MAMKNVKDEQDPHLERISSAIRVIPDFPKPGILFQDITRLLLDPKAFEDTIDLFVERGRRRRRKLTLRIRTTNVLAQSSPSKESELEPSRKRDRYQTRPRRASPRLRWPLTSITALSLLVVARNEEEKGKKLQLACSRERGGIEDLGHLESEREKKLNP